MVFHLGEFHLSFLISLMLHVCCSPFSLKFFVLPSHVVFLLAKFIIYLYPFIIIACMYHLLLLFASTFINKCKVNFSSTWNTYIYIYIYGKFICHKYAW